MLARKLTTHGSMTKSNATISDLNHQLLVAMPNLKDEMFEQSVVLIFENDEAGTMGFVTNKNLPITVGDILRQLEIKQSDLKANKVTLLQGGPVSKEQLYILRYHARRKVRFDLIQPQDSLDSFGEGKGLDTILPFLGYAGWGAGQLEKEILKNDWLVCPATPEILFKTPPEKRWLACLKTLGIDLENLRGNIGHA